MNWGTCRAGSNNIHPDFPPIMNDGRNYASWQPGSEINDMIRKQSGIHSNWQYRKYLMDNADTIIKKNQLEACNDCGNCPSTYSNAPSNSPNIDEVRENRKLIVSDVSPYLYKTDADSSKPYGYEKSDLKNIYLTKHQLYERLVTPVLSQDNLLQQKYANHN